MDKIETIIRDLEYENELLSDRLSISSGKYTALLVNSIPSLVSSPNLGQHALPADSPSEFLCEGNSSNFKNDRISTIMDTITVSDDGAQSNFMRLCPRKKTTSQQLKGRLRTKNYH